MMSRYKRMGWFGENYRHSLAAKGYKTSLAAHRGSNFVMSDIPVGESNIRYIERRPKFLLGQKRRSWIPGYGPKRYVDDVNGNKIVDDLAWYDNKDEAVEEIMEKLYPGSRRRDLLSPVDIKRQEDVLAELGGKSYGDYDEYLRYKQEQADIRDALDALDEKKRKKEHAALLEEMETQKDDHSSVGRGSFSALGSEMSVENPPALKNFLQQAMSDSWDYMSRPNDGLSVDNPLSASIRDSWSNWLPMKKEVLVGGRADNVPDKAFPSADLQKGVVVESEHTNDVRVAKEISKDHLAEDPKYYDKLEKMESGYYG